MAVALAVVVETVIPLLSIGQHHMRSFGTVFKEVLWEVPERPGVIIRVTRTPLPLPLPWLAPAPALPPVMAYIGKGV